MDIEDIKDALGDDDGEDVRKNLSKGLKDDEKFWKSYNEKKEIQKELENDE